MNEKITNYKIFITFLKLGCIAFGGPAAHLVLFHKIFSQNLKWLEEQQYFQILALAQILPGPTSSQVGLTIGYIKNGYVGAVCAWLGFTLPSAILMALAAILGQHFYHYLNGTFFHVIQLIVLAVVLWAFWQMLRSLCHQVWQYMIVALSAIFIYFVQVSTNQIIVIAVAAIIGMLFASDKKSDENNHSKKNIKKSKVYIWLIVFVLPLVLFPICYVIFPSYSWQIISNLYRSASLVFGGGHVILPLLHQDFVNTGQISQAQFDLGYAIVQLIPGPLFSFASYIGALLPLTSSAILNAIIATVVIFIPSFLLVFGTLPYWSWLVNQPLIHKAVQGINAAVVGLLLCLIVQMTEKYVLQWLDILFIMIVIMLLKSKFPVWFSILIPFTVYFIFLNQFSG